MSKRLSLPGEHGAHLTLAAAVVTAALLSGHPVPALAMALVLTMAFLARGPLERMAVRLPLRSWDRPALAGMVILAGAGSAGVMLEGPGPWSFLGLPAALLAAAGAFAARRTRHHRAVGLEVVAMGSLGASAGLIALCGGVAPPRAVGLALVLGAHAAASVLLLRTRLRPRARAGRRLALLEATALVALAALGLVALGLPVMMLALVPRAVQIALGLGRAHDAPRRAAGLGLIETALLATAVVTLVAVGR